MPGFAYQVRLLGDFATHHQGKKVAGEALSEISKAA
jgi:hypothetical protein